jgi:glycogen operon protein
VLLVNAHHEPIPFTLPSGGEGQEWERLIDTADPEVETIKQKVAEQYEIQGRSMVILRSKPPQPAELPDMK